MSKQLVHITDADGQVLYMNLVRQGDQNVMRFASGHGFVCVDECKRRLWNIVPGPKPAVRAA